MAVAYDHALALAGDYDAAGGRMREWAGRSGAVLLDADLLESALLSPVSFAEAEAAVLAATSGPDGVLVASVVWEADAVTIRVAVRATQLTDDLVAQTWEVLDHQLGFAVGYTVAAGAPTLVLPAAGLALLWPRLPPAPRRCSTRASTSCRSGWSTTRTPSSTSSTAAAACSRGCGTARRRQRRVDRSAYPCSCPTPRRRPGCSRRSTATDTTRRPPRRSRSQGPRRHPWTWPRWCSTSPRSTPSRRDRRGADDPHGRRVGPARRLPARHRRPDDDAVEPGRRRPRPRHQLPARQRPGQRLPAGHPRRDAAGRRPAGRTRRPRRPLPGRHGGGRDPRQGSPYAVTHVVTAGAPTAHLDGFPPGSHVLSLENRGDVVPLLDGEDNPDSAEQVTVRFDDHETTVVGSHDLAKYVHGALAVQASDDPSDPRAAQQSGSGRFRRVRGWAGGHQPGLPDHSGAVSGPSGPIGFGDVHSGERLRRPLKEKHVRRHLGDAQTRGAAARAGRGHPRDGRAARHPQ